MPDDMLIIALRAIVRGLTRQTFDDDTLYSMFLSNHHTALVEMTVNLMLVAGVLIAVRKALPKSPR